jgi:hypothetical protein
MNGERDCTDRAAVDRFAAGFAAVALGGAPVSCYMRIHALEAVPKTGLPQSKAASASSSSPPACSTPRACAAAAPRQGGREARIPRDRRTPLLAPLRARPGKLDA